MSPNPTLFIHHLQEKGYHPRSDKHSNVLAEAIVRDLVTHCLKIREAVAVGQIVYELNFALLAGTAEWNIDLVMGSPEFGFRHPSEQIFRKTPSTVQIAIEIKSVMTEHRKAVKNRKRDLEAHQEHVHNYNAETIAEGVLVINGSELFRSPLRLDNTRHREPKGLVKHCIDELRSVSVRGGRTGYGLEARCAIVVIHDNINNASTHYLEGPPAPGVGDPLHYDAFIQAICSHYVSRF